MFRLNSKYLAITYPQCDVPRDVCLANLKNKLDKWGIDKYIVAQETHLSGTLHLHCFISLYKRCDIKNSDWLDLPLHHGNYQVARDPKNWAEYCLKDDREALRNIEKEDIQKLRSQRKASKREEVCKRLLDGDSLIDIISDVPATLYDIKKYQEAMVLYENLSNKFEKLPKFIENPWGLIIVSNQTIKRRHYWLYSSGPNLGKTTWAKSLEKYGVHIKGGDFTYWNLRGNEPIIIMNDYNSAGVKWNYLNTMCDGTCDYRIFQGGVKKVKSALIVVLSNCSLKEIYPFKHNTLEARFIEICLDIYKL